MGLLAESREPLGEREPEALNKGRVGRAGSRASSELAGAGCGAPHTGDLHPYYLQGPEPVEVGSAQGC